MHWQKKAWRWLRNAGRGHSHRVRAASQNPGRLERTYPIAVSALAMMRSSNSAHYRDSPIPAFRSIPCSKSAAPEVSPRVRPPSAKKGEHLFHNQVTYPNFILSATIFAITSKMISLAYLDAFLSLISISFLFAGTRSAFGSDITNCRSLHRLFRSSSVSSSS